MFELEVFRRGWWRVAAGLELDFQRLIRGVGLGAGMEMKG